MPEHSSNQTVTQSPTIATLAELHRFQLQGFVAVPGMMDEDLSKFIEMTFRHTETLMSRSEVTWQIARAGAQKIMAQLIQDHPQRAEEINNAFSEWIKKIDLRSRH